jgi:hypothetical protein
MVGHRRQPLGSRQLAVADAHGAWQVGRKYPSGVVVGCRRGPGGVEVPEWGGCRLPAAPKWRGSARVGRLSAAGGAQEARKCPSGAVVGCRRRPRAAEVPEWGDCRADTTSHRQTSGPAAGSCRRRAALPLPAAPRPPAPVAARCRSAVGRCLRRSAAGCGRPIAVRRGRTTPSPRWGVVGTRKIGGRPEPRGYCAPSPATASSISWASLSTQSKVLVTAFFHCLYRFSRSAGSSCGSHRLSSAQLVRMSSSDSQ